MKPGILQVKALGQPRTATANPDGWQCADGHFLRFLELRYPFPATEAGTPWVQAFWKAAVELMATVVQEPEA